MNQVRQASAEIETPRLRLVLFAADDLDQLSALYGDPEVMGGRKLGVQSRAECAAWLAGYVAHWRARGFGMWSLRTRAGLLQEIRPVPDLSAAARPGRQDPGHDEVELVRGVAC